VQEVAQSHGPGLYPREERYVHGTTESKHKPRDESSEEKINQRVEPRVLYALTLPARRSSSLSFDCLTLMDLTAT
jgi:hypothetical protein